MAKPTEKQNIADVFPDIVSRVASGELLTDLCKEYGFTTAWFHKWLNQDQSRVDSYARGREEQQHAWADQIVKLADVCRVGNKVTEKSDGMVETVTADMVERTRLQIESRKWLMARLNPKAYGDKIQTESKVELSGSVRLIDRIVNGEQKP